jgi:hypothetical protein
VFTGAPVVSINRGQEKEILTVDFTPDGQHLVVGIQGGLDIWKMPPVHEIRVLKAKMDRIKANKELLVSRRLERALAELRRPKGEFETDQKYQARLNRADRKEPKLRRKFAADVEARINSLRGELQSRIESPVSSSISVGEYKAESRALDVRIFFDGRTVKVPIPPRKAKTVVPALRKQKDPTARIDYRLSATDSLRIASVSLDHEGETYTYEAEPGPTRPETVSKPPQLTASAPSFTDASGDNRLSAGESATLRFTVENSGSGPARGLQAKGKTEAAIEGLSTRIGTLPPGEKKTVKLQLRGQQQLTDGTATIEMRVSEASGFGTTPITIEVPTRAYRPPELSLKDVAVNDQAGNGNGQIEPGEVVKITARLVNTGGGAADGLIASLEAGKNVFLGGTEQGTTQKKLGSLPPGDYADITFEAFCNSQAESFPITLTASSTGKGTLMQTDLGLSLEETFQRPQNLVVEADPSGDSSDRSAPPSAPSLTIDIETDIPKTGMDRPDAVAIVMGIRRYSSENVPAVKYARRDARVMREYLTKTLGFRDENILPRNPDGRVTYAEMRTLIQEKLPSYVKEGTSDVFVFYSGHGAPTTGKNRQGYLVPSDTDPNYVSDANAYALRDFYTDLSKVGAKSMTVVLDACFTGQSGSGEMMIRKASPSVLSVENPFLAIDDGTAFLASSTEQVANWYPKKKHGMFTYFFLKGLKGAADLNGDRRLTVAEMEKYLTNENEGVPYWSRRVHQRKQVPQVVTQDKDQLLVRYAE